MEKSVPRLYKSNQKPISNIDRHEEYCRRISQRLTPFIRRAVKESAFQGYSIQLTLFFCIDESKVKVAMDYSNELCIHLEGPPSGWMPLPEAGISIDRSEFSCDQIIDDILQRIKQTLSEVAKQRLISYKLVLFFTEGNFAGSRKIIDEKG